ncbi:MAG: 16S rRNA (cytidine(1402)-2'-O)-methyltransferase [Paenibacillaceae bacterium]
MKVQRSFNQESASSYGTLYLVATPIGNLEDMTFRAVRTLREANWIAAEDTRQTRKLLTHFDIQGRLVTYHEHNIRTSGPELVSKMKLGETVALVSDAGLPAISDPGEDLVRLAIEEGIAVVPIPGANAALSALIISGLPTDKFRFVGFLPRDKKRMRRSLEQLVEAEDTLIIYESPHRISATLEIMLDVLGDRRVALVRELTKKFEEVARGQLSESLLLLEEHPPKGEYCIIIEGGTVNQDDGAAWWEQMTIAEHVEHYEAMQISRKEALKKTAVDRGVSKRDIYNQLL